MLRRRSQKPSQDKDDRGAEEIPMKSASLFRRSKHPEVSEDESQSEQQTDDAIHTGFTPTNFFHITPHNGLSKTIKVFPVSSDTLSAPFGSNAFKEKVKSICEAYKNLSKDVKETDAGHAYLTASKSRWYQRTLSINLPLAGETDIAEWKGGAFSASKNVITFDTAAVEEAHCSHTLTQTVDSFWKFRESFVVDSVPYLWVCNNLWTMLDFSLFKMAGGNRVEVARYWQGFKVLQTSGVLAVDESEVDAVVACLTCLVVLRKKRQKDEERRN
jgi:hypothetical protein